MLQQLTDQDAIFLYGETAETPAHVGGLSLVDLPDGHRGDFFAEYKATIARRMALVPFLHTRVARVPLDLDRPFWVEDEHIDLDYHVRRATVPPPGTMTELEALVALLHQQPLDRTRPLWQFYVIDGLASGQLAVYTKMHHAAMDGAASQQLITTMYDPTPSPRSLPCPALDVAHHRPSARNLVTSLLARRVQQAIRAAQFVPDLVQAVSHMVLPDPETLRFRPIHRVPRTPTTLLNIGITSQRVFAARTLPLSDVKQLARLTGTTVNDVVLALCSGALHGYLADKRRLPERSLTAMVPVSLRMPGDFVRRNQNAMMICSLASDIADPYERLLAIHRSAIAQKQNLEIWKGLPAPDVVIPGLGRIVRRLIELYGHSRLVGRPPLAGNLVISNVPGPASPLYIAGAKIASMFPCSIPFHGQAVNITVESYCDRLDFGLIACRRAVPDVAQLADRLTTSLAELQRAVARACPVAAPPVVTAPAVPPVVRVAPAVPVVIDPAAERAPAAVLALAGPSNGKSRSAELPA
jgi:WS/DGAT/MGAT family acyltransferase